MCMCVYTCVCVICVINMCTLCMYICNLYCCMCKIRTCFSQNPPCGNCWPAVPWHIQQDRLCGSLILGCLDARIAPVRHPSRIVPVERHHVAFDSVLVLFLVKHQVLKHNVVVVSRCHGHVAIHHFMFEACGGCVCVSVYLGMSACFNEFKTRFMQRCLRSFVSGFKPYIA